MLGLLDSLLVEGASVEGAEGVAVVGSVLEESAGTGAELVAEVSLGAVGEAGAVVSGVAGALVAGAVVLVESVSELLLQPASISGRARIRAEVRNGFRMELFISKLYRSVELPQRFFVNLVDDTKS